MTFIRKETRGDLAAIYEVNLQAFGQPAEAKLVDLLREAGGLASSLVAEQDGQVVGYLAMSPVSIVSDAGAKHALALAPVAVLPSFQRRGIGTALIRHWLATQAREEDNAVVVLGHADYYPRFGFVPARPCGITCEYEVPDENFMVLELQPGVLQEIRGMVKYHEAFSKLE
jgi:putative acetyltransferase